MWITVLMVFCIGVINASQPAPVSYSVMVKKVEDGQLQIDVNEICRAAGFVKRDVRSISAEHTILVDGGRPKETSEYSPTTGSPDTVVKSEHDAAARAENGTAMRSDHKAAARAENGTATGSEHEAAARAGNGTATGSEHEAAARAVNGTVKNNTTTKSVHDFGPTNTVKNHTNIQSKQIGSKPVGSDDKSGTGIGALGILLVSLVAAGIVVGISYLVYTRHRANSYVLPEQNIAEATPLNNIS